MVSRLCARHFQGNGYGFDGPWRYDSQRLTATREALFICREWIDGRENLADYRDAIMALVTLYGEGVKPACKCLWIAGLPEVSEHEEKKLYYYDAGMDLLTRYFRRHSDYQQVVGEVD